MLQSNSATIPPSLPLPAENESSHPVDQVFGIRMQFDLRMIRKGPKRFNGRDQFHFRDRGPGLCSG
jgi:hypothetical protein